MCIRDSIILAAHPAGLLNVLILGEKKLGVGDPAVALPARNQPAAVRLLWIFGVVDDVTDCLSYGAAFAGVQGHQACGCHRVFTSQQNKTACRSRPFHFIVYRICSVQQGTVLSFFLLSGVPEQKPYRKFFENIPRPFSSLHHICNAVSR